MCLFGNKPCFLPRKPPPPRPIAHPTSFENPTFQAFIKKKSSHLDETSTPPKRACNPACISLGVQVLVCSARLVPFVRAFSFSEKRNSKSHGLSRPKNHMVRAKILSRTLFCPLLGTQTTLLLPINAVWGEFLSGCRLSASGSAVERGASRPLHASNPPKRQKADPEHDCALFQETMPPKHQTNHCYP